MTELYKHPQVANVFANLISEGVLKHSGNYMWGDSVAEFVDLMLVRYGETLLAAGESGSE